MGWLLLCSGIRDGTDTRHHRAPLWRKGACFGRRICHHKVIYSSTHNSLSDLSYSTTRMYMRFYCAFTYCCLEALTRARRACTPARKSSSNDVV